MIGIAVGRSDGAETRGEVGGGRGRVEAAGRLLALAEAVEAAEVVEGGARLERAERVGDGEGGGKAEAEDDTIFREMG